MTTGVGRPRKQPSATTSTSGPGASADAARSDQRSRLLEAIVDVVARDGYPEAKIGDIAKRAGVSRATFYELFANKEECLLAAQRTLSDRLGTELAAAIAQDEPNRAAQSALSALADFADREPHAFDFLMHEAMLAGLGARYEHDLLMSRLEHAIERSWGHAPPDAQMLDMSAKVLLEGTVRLLGMRIRRDGDAPGLLLGDLTGWIDTYSSTPDRHAGGS